MPDRKGDPDKKPDYCKNKGLNERCRNLKEVSDKYDMDGETYDCAVCGEHYRLYYDEMR